MEAFHSPGSKVSPPPDSQMRERGRWARAETGQQSVPATRSPLPRERPASNRPQPGRPRLHEIALIQTRMPACEPPVVGWFHGARQPHTRGTRAERRGPWAPTVQTRDGLVRRGRPPAEPQGRRGNLTAVTQPSPPVAWAPWACRALTHTSGPLDTWGLSSLRPKQELPPCSPFF